MKSTFVAVLLLVALTLTVAAQQRPAQSQTAEAALGAAIDLDEVKRDLDAAIAAYKAFLSKYGSNRPLAAKAQYRLGLAYEKKGDGQARMAYERVVQQFPDQKDLVRDAERRLAALPDTRTAASQPTSRLVLTVSNQDGDFNVSPDGRWLVQRGNREGGGDLRVRDVRSGRVTRVGDCNGRANCRAESAVFSADSRRIAYELALYGPPDFLQQPLEGALSDAMAASQFELRVVANEPGAKSRLISRQPHVHPMDWSADGRAILGLTQPDSGLPEIVWISVENGSPKVVKSFTDRRVRSAKLSPDGKYIAYVAAPPNSTTANAESAPEPQIYVLAANGSSESQVTFEAVNTGPGWSPDGNQLVFVSNRGGDSALWSIRVSAGRGVGEPQLVRRDTGPIASIGITRGGSYYYEKPLNVGLGYDVFEAQLDPATGKLSSAVRYTSERFVGQNCCASWSPDGRRVAFKRFRLSNPDIRDIVVREVATGSERTYTAPDWTNTRYGFGPGAPKWIDNTTLFVGDEPIVGQSRWLGRMDLDARFTKVVQIPAELGWVTALSPDMKTAYALRRKGDRPRGTYSGVMAVDLATGRRTSVFDAPDGRVYSLDVAADSRTLALWIQPDPGGRTSSTLATLQADGTQYREVYTTTKRIEMVPDQVQWSGDGRTLFFQEDGRLMRIPATGGTPEFLMARQTPEQAHGFRVNADSSRVAVTEGARRQPAIELWAIDNLMSAAKAR